MKVRYFLLLGLPLVLSSCATDGYYGDGYGGYYPNSYYGYNNYRGGYYHNTNYYHGGGGHGSSGYH